MLALRAAYVDALNFKIPNQFLVVVAESGGRVLRGGKRRPWQAAPAHRDQTLKWQVSISQRHRHSLHENPRAAAVKPLKHGYCVPQISISGAQ